MSVTPVTVDGLPTLTLAAGAAGGVAVAGSIDSVNDYLLIYTNSATATQGINRNTLLGLSSVPLGLSDTQSPTNKTFNATNAYTTKDGSLTLQNTSDVTKQGKFSLAGVTTGNTRTYTLPDASVTLASLTGTETFTNKTFTSPTINAPTITNATLSVDAVTGYSTSNSGTLYRISVTTGQISTSNSVLPGALATGIQASKFSNPYKFFAYRSTTWTTATSAAAVVFNATLFDTGTNYSTSTGAFTAPITGFYQFFVVVGTGGSVRSLVAIYKNGSEFIRLYDSNTVSAGPLDVNGSILLSLAANDTVQVYLTTGSGVTGGYGTTPYYTVFSGNLLSPT